MTTRVVGYIRVSDASQVDTFSLDAQRHSIQQACSYHGHELVTILADEGRSAFTDTLTKRPALREAIDMVLSGSADALMVDKLDRLARRARVFHDILHRLNNRVIFVREGIDPTTPTGELVAGILAQSAQFFSRNLGTETRKGKQERVRSGLWLGALPYGYIKQPGDDRGKLPPLPDDAPAYTARDGATLSRADVVREVFAMAADGETRRSIAQSLHERGLTDISRALVDHMLRSRFYLGEIPMGRSSRSEGAREWVPGIHPPLIDRATFQAAQDRARENRRRASVATPSRPVHALSGLGRCGRCGATMHCQREGVSVRLFCSSRHNSDLCDQISVLTSRIEPQLLDALRAYATPTDIADALARAIGEGHTDTTAEQRIVAEQLRRLQDVYVAYGRMTEAEYREKAATLHARLEALRASAGSINVRELSAMLQDLPSTYLQAEPPMRNRLVRRVFSEILIDNQEMVAVRPKPAIDAMLRARMTLGTDAQTFVNASAPSSLDAADWLRPLSEGWWAIPVRGAGSSSYPKIPRAWWPQIVREYREGVSGPKLAQRYGVKSPQTIYLILEKQRALEMQS